MILQVLIAMVAGWLQRHQQQVIAYLLAENRVLKAQLRGRRLRLTDPERRRLATLAHLLGRTRLQDVTTIATPETLLRWYYRLIAQKFDGSQQRRPCGRPRIAEEVEQLIVRMAEETHHGATAGCKGPWQTLASTSMLARCGTSYAVTTWSPPLNDARPA